MADKRATLSSQRAQRKSFNPGFKPDDIAFLATLRLCEKYLAVTRRKRGLNSRRDAEAQGDQKI
jgi:hypothetical protein